MIKSIIFDWFTIFKFHDDFKLGKRRRFALFCIKKLIKWGWRVYIFRPAILYADPNILRQKVRQAGIPVFEILYGLHSLNRVPFKRGVYIDVAYFYLIGALWPLLWIRCIQSLKKVG